ncbi:MAG TPA: glycosyl hydrolase [Saprospiraceae bacterium]|nr:glycosyl hydrolase [Saprospiraceae bacterium]
MKKYLLAVVLVFGWSPFLFCQKGKTTRMAVKPTTPVPEEPVYPFDESHFKALKWRNIGPFRGGRVTAICGIPDQIYTFYMGSTGGGIWKTTDGGNRWTNVSDGFVKTGSVGSIQVAASDPNVVVAGMGESPIRGVMTSHGDGVYKSTDAGRTWTHLGLQKVRQISQIRIHPNDPDLIYVGAQGSPYEPTEDRGVYRSRDGGKTWQKILFVNKNSGVSDLSMDLKNPRVLYAAFWDMQRQPWYIRSGGPGSGIWKSTDGGDTWKKLTTGLPKSIMGKIGVSVSMANPQRVYAMIESDEGGLYRSEDGGNTWALINADRILRARAWYYTHVYADPQNPDRVIVLNAPYLESTDGGKTFKNVQVPHGDNHDLWINPHNNQFIANANDGGANISYNGGLNWSEQSNQPTAQFYRVNADHRFPYWVYGGQQDNTAMAIQSRTAGPGISGKDWVVISGCESAWPAFDPDNPRYIYAGCYQGIIEEYDWETREVKDVMAYSFLGLGTKPADQKYRFNWNAPILVSKFNPKTIYHGGNKVLKSEDRGISWTEISPDLTRNEVSKQGQGGGPITSEGAGGENYNTLACLAESPLESNVLWAGSDCGLIHVTRDGGKSWANVTPADLKEGLVHSIEASPHDPGTAYVAFTRYKFNDFTPYIYITRDYGKTWTLRTRGIGEEAHMRVVREDPARKDLLYAGTETGMYISFNGGAHWQPFQLNLPVVPITDLKVHQGDLIVSTAGRSFWILDDLKPLHEYQPDLLSQKLVVYQPEPAYRFGGGMGNEYPGLGLNPPAGVVIYYHLNIKDTADQVTVQILDEKENIIRSYASSEKTAPKKAPRDSAMNRLVWDFRTEAQELPEGLLVLGGNSGYRLAPGKYRVKVSYGNETANRDIEVRADPRHQTTPDQYNEQQSLLRELKSSLDDVYDQVKRIRYIKDQIGGFTKRADLQDQDIKTLAGNLSRKLDSLENKMVQPRTKTFQDVINFENQLDAKLKHIMDVVDESLPPVTQGQKTRARELINEWISLKQAVSNLTGEELKQLNELIRKSPIPFISTEREAAKTGKS